LGLLPGRGPGERCPGVAVPGGLHVRWDQLTAAGRAVATLLLKWELLFCGAMTAPAQHHISGVLPLVQLSALGPLVTTPYTRPFDWWCTHMHRLCILQLAAAALRGCILPKVLLCCCFLQMLRSSAC
jgi:hypothetical protein